MVNTDYAIGNSSDFTAELYDDDTDATSHYHWYMKPEDCQMSIGTPETLKQIIEMDSNLCVQMGKKVVQFTLKNILICAQSGPSTAIQELEKLKRAIMFWATGNAGAEYGGKLLTFCAKDVGGNVWSRIGTWTVPEADTPMTSTYDISTKIIDPIIIQPQPNGDFLIKELRIMNFEAITSL